MGERWVQGGMLLVCKSLWGRSELEPWSYFSLAFRGVALLQRYQFGGISTLIGVKGTYRQAAYVF